MAGTMDCRYLVGIILCMAVLSGIECAITWTKPTGGDTTKSDINEGATGTIFTFTATGTGAITYTIDSQSVANTFTIAGATGILTLASGKSLDFETNPTHIVKVKAVDSATTPVTSTGTLTINLQNVNEAPTYPYVLQRRVVEAGLVAGSVIGTVQFTDEDTGDTISYSFLSGNSAGDLVIGATSGVITVASSKTLQATDQYVLVIKAVDNNATPKSGTTVYELCVGTCAFGGASSLVALSALTLLGVMLRFVL